MECIDIWWLAEDYVEAHVSKYVLSHDLRVFDSSRSRFLLEDARMAEEYFHITLQSEVKTPPCTLVAIFARHALYAYMLLHALMHDAVVPVCIDHRLPFRVDPKKKA